MKKLTSFTYILGAALILASHQAEAAGTCQKLVSFFIKSKVERTVEVAPSEKVVEALARNPRAEDFFKDYDRRAMALAKKLSLKNEDLKVEVSKWFEEVKKGMPSVIELTTLQLVLKTGIFNNAIDTQTHQAMEEFMSYTWMKLTGQNKNAAAIMAQPLPDSVLKFETLQIQRFHKLAVKINPETLKMDSGKLQSIVNKMLPVSMLAFGLSGTGGDVISGALIGYGVSLAAEYWIHRWIMHSGKSKETLPWYAGNRIYTMGSMLNLARSHFSHHQELNVRNYTKKAGADDINSAYVKNELTPKLVENGMTPDRVESYVVETSHATVMEKQGWLTASTTIAPASVALAAFVGADPVLAGMTAALSAYSFILHVNYVHPKMHETYEHNRAKGNALDRWFVNSSYFRYVARFHYMHHARPNTNLSVLPLGYDALLGTESKLPLADLVKLLEQDLPL